MIHNLKVRMNSFDENYLRMLKFLEELKIKFKIFIYPKNSFNRKK
jgi:hypothetical protein